MSATEAMPRSPSAASIRGPTPESSVTGLERRAVRVVREGSMAPCASPALEVGHAIGSQADVRTDDAADLGDELLLHPEVLRELGDELGRGDVPEIQRSSGLDGWPYLVHDRGHLPLASASALEGRDLSAGNLQYGPDVQRRPDKPLRPADAPALGQVLERADGEEHVRPPDGPLRDASDLVEISALVYALQGFEEDQTRAHLSAPGVEHVDGAVDHLGRLKGRAVRPAELCREREHPDIVVVGERLVGLDESARGWLGRGREHVRVAQTLVELGIGHIDLISVRLV